LDFPRSALYFNSMPGIWVDERDMSGLHLLKQNRKVFVYSVDQQSPAESCGIKAGDVIEQIDGQVTSLMTMKAVRARFEGKDSECRAVQLVRGNQQLNVNITLRKAI
jgi:C-terminal processing protease CtpA/Prc